MAGITGLRIVIGRRQRAEPGHHRRCSNAGNSISLLTKHSGSLLRYRALRDTKPEPALRTAISVDRPRFFSLKKCSLENFSMKLIVASEYVHSLLFRDGKFVRVLEPGKYRFWGNFEVIRVPKWPEFLMVYTSDILTLDGASMRLGFTLTVTIADPVAVARTWGTNEFAARNAWETQARTVIDGELRTWLATRKFEEAMSESAELPKRLTELVGPALEVFGGELNQLTMTQFGVTGAVKTAYAELLRAELEAKAALQRARGEAATMRSLMNTARLVRENPGLMELRVLTSGAKPRVTFNVSSLLGEGGLGAEEVGTE